MHTSSKNVQIEDLGRQAISGIDGQGLHRRYVLPAGSDANFPSSSTERWCSDELGAILKQIFLAGGTRKTETVLQNIVRREPDPALFQIPSDYTIVQPETGRMTSP